MNTPAQTAKAAKTTALPARLIAIYQRLVNTLNHLQPLAALLARAYVAQAFFLSGLTKVRDWSVTLYLFQNEYHVPLLPPEVAAVMGTAGELGLSVLLMLGLGGRFAALGLSVVNRVAVLSLSDIAPAALQQHVTWGVLLAALALYGCGPWTRDTWLARHVKPVLSR